MKNTKYDSLENPKAFRWQSILFLIFVVLGYFSALECILSLYPESGKVASHWDIAGKPNDWVDVDKNKNFARGFSAIIFAFIFLLMWATVAYEDIVDMPNPYRGKLLEKYPKLKKLKIWLIKNLSKLDYLSYILLCISLIFLAINYFVVMANEVESNYMSLGIYFLIPMSILLFMPITLWEASYKK